MQRPPGWYPDPISPDALIRRWDGSDWTADIRSVEQVRLAPQASGTPDSAPVQGVIDCPACGGDVSLHATACPHCGHPIVPNAAAPAAPAPAAKDPDASVPGSLPPPPPGYSVPGTPAAAGQTPAAPPRAGTRSQSGAPASAAAGAVARGGAKAGGAVAGAARRDPRALAALCVAGVALVLGLLGRGSASYTMLGVLMVAAVAGWVLASSAARHARRLGASPSWMVPVARVCVLVALALFALSVYGIIRDLLPT